MNKGIPRRFPSLEGLLLITLSLAMILLMASGNHWLYLSPRFEWLSCVTAGLLLLVGIVATMQPGRCLKASSTIIFGTFVVLGVAGNAVVLEPRPADWGFYRPHRATDEEPYKTFNGVDYTRINLAELYEIAEMHPDKHETLYVVRGLVQRTPQWDAQGEFLLVRTLVWCCLADAISVGFRIQDFPRDSNLPESGQWIELYGSIKKAAVESETLLPQTLQSLPANIHPVHVFVPLHAALIEEPEISFIFEVRNAAPYAF